MARVKDTSQEPIVLVLMGVSGAGKSTIGKRLAETTNRTFADADDFHPPSNVEKMAAGEPLDDGDRKPWLQALRAFIDRQIEKKEPTVLACSALKAAYRRRLGTGRNAVELVYLRGSFDQIQQRISGRTDHFFDAELLSTQFDALEAPDGAEALIIDVSATPAKIVEAIREALALPQAE